MQEKYYMEEQICIADESKLFNKNVGNWTHITQVAFWLRKML